MKVSVIGATGYSGIELIKILNKHSFVEISSLHSHSPENYDKNIQDILPHLGKCVDLKVTELDYDWICETSDLVFSACPSGVSKEVVAELVKRYQPVIDLSGDFRLDDSREYKKYYGMEMDNTIVQEKFLYNLPDLSSHITSSWVSNPGCYATATLLALAPLIKNHLISDLIIVDAKSGLSGAGKALTNNSHFSTMNENMKMYKVNTHQHIPEIQQQLKKWSDGQYKLQFNTSLIPVTRGIFVASYVQLKPGLTLDDVQLMYEKEYNEKYFIRLQPKGQLPELKQVIGSNFCDIGLAFNAETGILTVVSVIDNLIKGASGQAVQNMNLMFGYDEKEGLDFLPIYP